MKKLLILLMGVYALNAGSITPLVTKDDLSKVDTTSSVWKKAKIEKIKLYPQMTVVAIDKAADKTQQDKPVDAEIQAVVSDQFVAIKLVWSDSTESKVVSTNSYADGFAVQFPADQSKALPYIGMGDPRSGVVVHIRKNGTGYASVKGFDKQLSTQSINLYGKELEEYQKEGKELEKKEYFKTFVAQGFRTMTEVEDTSAKSSMIYKKGKYEAVIVRAISDSNANLQGALIPVAVAVWDGDKAGRDGAKWLSSWQVVVVDSTKADQARLADMIDEPKGDVVKGKELAVASCSACHIFDGNDNGMPYMAPNLSTLGGQATASYIRESIVDPSAVVVPGYNRYAHPNMAWSAGGASTMPAFDYMSADEIEAIVAYFKSLK